MATLKEQEELVEILKFTPRTYTIQLWGYGGEKVMGTVDRKIYDYFRSRRLDVSEYAWDSDYAELHNIPEEMQPFPPGSWYECDGLAHVNGVSKNAGTLQIWDENNNEIVNLDLDGIDGDEGGPRLESQDEVWIGCAPEGAVVFVGSSNEKGTFFEGEFALRAPFDINKLTLVSDEIDGEDVIYSIMYDGEDLDNIGGSTDGKSSDFSFNLVKDTHNWVAYKNMDDIEYPMTEWFPKKINPVRVGNYMVRTAGKDSYTYQCRWTGEKWISAYSTSDSEVKIKQWQGLAIDPDTFDTLN